MSPDPRGACCEQDTIRRHTRVRTPQEIQKAALAAAFTKFAEALQ